jgi:Reverse transcriptase (RNA-dependent DNA polymerase)
MKEFQDALKTCNGSSSGPDDIHYEMIKQLGEKEKEMLLGIYNDIWQQGCYPEEWRKALTIPIQKPGKDPENPESYRPISLTSCLGKVMEKIVNRRLVYILEERKLIPEQQYGFRCGRSTIDVLNILQSKIS